MSRDRERIADIAIEWAVLKREAAVARDLRSPGRCERIQSEDPGEAIRVTACCRERDHETGDKTDSSTWCATCRDADVWHGTYRRLIRKVAGAEMRLRRAALATLPPLPTP